MDAALSTDWTDVYAHAAYPGTGYLLFKLSAVVDATTGFKAHITRFIGVKRSAGERLWRAGIDALLAIFTAVGNRFAGF